MSGQTLEDVLEYARVSTLYDWLSPAAVLKDKENVGFPTRIHTAVGPLADSNTGKRELTRLDGGNSKRVMHKPIFGILNQNKYLPTQYMPLTFEFTLTHDAASWLHTGTTDGVDNSTQWHISDAYMYFDVISLDAEVQNNYAQILRQGQALNISYHSSLCQSQAVLGS